MDFAQLSTITDATILRGMVVDKLNEIALHTQHISAQAKTLAERDAVIAKSDAVIARRDESIRTRDIHIEALTHEIARLRRMQFAAKSERMDPEQRALFDDTMAADLAAAEAALDALKTLTTETPPATPRVAPKRRPLPPELPRVTTVHAPDCSGCSQCGGELVQIGEHVRERLACKPMRSGFWMTGAAT